MGAIAGRQQRQSPSASAYSAALSRRSGRSAARTAADPETFCATPTSIFQRPSRPCANIGCRSATHEPADHHRRGTSYRLLMNRWSLDTSPGYMIMDLISRMVSPYNLNPFGHNPIRSILEDSIDFTDLNEAPIKLFITA